MAASTAREMTALLADIRAGADAVCRLAVEPGWTVADAREIAARAAAGGPFERGPVQAAVCARALGDPRLPALPPRLAAEALVRILAALAPVSRASLWRPEGRSVACIVSAGAEGDDRRSRAAARAVLAGRRAASLGPALAVPVRCRERPAAALVVTTDTGSRPVAAGLLDDAAGALALVLEREALLELNAERERRLVEASERRLTRLAFDIHDGPIQTVAALGLELRLLAGDDPADAPSRAARARDLHERLAALEAELRELTQTLEPTSIARRPLDATLRGQAEAFGRRHGVSVSVETGGDLAGLTPSQRIALVRVVHEALTNACDHGGATDVRVAVNGDRGGVSASVTDDGCGFEVASVLPAAARKGRLGIVGMSERMRLLGGHLAVESRPGGPTTIEARLPRWSPGLTAAEAEVQAAARPVSTAS